MYSAIVNFFSTKSIKGKITDGTLSEAQLFIYFYLIVMFDTLSFVQQWLGIAGKQPTILDWVNVWGLLVINSIGFIILYVANGGSRGKDFLKKYFSLSFTVGFKYFIIFFIYSVILTSPTYGIATFIILNSLMVAMLLSTRDTLSLKLMNNY